MNAIINPMLMNAASNPGTDEPGVGLVVGAVQSTSQSSTDIASGVGIEASSPATPSGDGVVTGVVDDADTDVDVAPLPWSAIVGEIAVVASGTSIDPLLMVTGVSLYEVSPNKMILRFSGVEPDPVASNVTLAKMTSPPTPCEFNADIWAIPIVLFMLGAAICDMGPSVTAVTCTTSGSYSSSIVPVP